MKKENLIKKLNKDIADKTIVPQTLKASPIDEGEDARIAVDIRSISKLGLKPGDVIDIYREKGVLIYDSRTGNSPIVISGEVKVVDMKQNPL